MAKKSGENSAQLISNSFTKGLNKDSDPTYISEGMWTHARNASNNTWEGDIGTISNESSNYLCATAGATMPSSGQYLAPNKYIIGAIQLYSDRWIIFTAAHNQIGVPILSEIGLLIEDRCIYMPIVQDTCLGFDKRYLITGSAREKEDCTWQVYWADGLNPDRFLNIGDPQTWPDPSVYTTFGQYGTVNQNTYLSATGNTLQWPGVTWTQICCASTTCCQTAPGVWPTNIPNCPPDNACITCTDTKDLDCNALRLARLMETPCLNLELGVSGGTLLNGTYFAVIAYSIKGQRVTDYFSPSNTQPIWYPSDSQGSLTLNLEVDSDNFDEFILVIVQNVNQGTVAKQIGIYSTRTTRIELDRIKEDLITVPIEQLPILNPVYETSDQITEANNYLLRIGPRSKFDFNYQPLANLIRAKWVAVEYPADYYVKGGNKGSYYRDEVYAFFIRWVYDTGDKSSSYHIPGRPPGNYAYQPPNGGAIQIIPETTNGINDINTLDDSDRIFEMYNTATVQPIPATLNTTLNDGGVVIGYGDMGYWESTEKYPDDKPLIWNSSSHCWTGFLGNQSINVNGSQWYPNDLCAQQIRHHKFPDNSLIDANGNPVGLHYRPNPGINTQELKIRIMGVTFENIILPVDNDGNLIPNIVGFEILRGSREGSRTILAKGMINNFRSYALPEYPLGLSGTSIQQGLYANYPFNTITPVQAGNIPGGPYSDPYIKSSLFQQVPQDIVSIHSPDLMFSTPYLSATELKIYGELRGNSQQFFKYPDNHPKHKLLSDFVPIAAFVAGVAEAIIAMTGKRTTNTPSLTSYNTNYSNSTITVPGAGTLITTPAQLTALAAIKLLIDGTPQIGPIPAVPGWNDFILNYYDGTAFLDALAPLISSPTTYETTLNAFLQAVNNQANTAKIAPLTIAGSIELPPHSYLPVGLRSLGALNVFSYYWSEGANVAIDAVYTFVKYEQYALQSIAHGFYPNWGQGPINQAKRFKIDDSFYIRDNIQQMSAYQNNTTGIYKRYTINNLQRGDTAVIRTLSGPYFNPANPNGTSTGPYFITGANRDVSLVTMSGLNGNTSINNNVTTNTLNSQNPNWTDIDQPFSLPIASHYAALKYRIRNQYGQLESIKQIPITPCEQKLSNYSVQQLDFSCTSGQYVLNGITRTDIFFGGDIFINRYTEKNTMLFFYNWLYGQPDGFEFNYYLYSMIPKSRFWANTLEYEAENMAPSNWNASITSVTGVFPTAFYKLDNTNYNFNNDSVSDYPGFWRAKESYFYLANSGVRDFFVESEVLVDFRISGDLEFEKHYDPYRYTDLYSMFNMDPQVITRGNIWRYDYSFSITKLYNQYFSSGNLQSRYYDPFIAQLCYTYLPDRIIYSLPQQEAAFKDSWFIYLVNNYKDFISQVSGVKSINKSGIFITFKNDSPTMYQGVDTLQTDLGTKITIGDGGLFSQPGQFASNADKPYEYGSSQDKFSIIGTPAGIYYISQNQGKIFLYSGNLKEISQAGMKWWFNYFLPYKLTEDFPDYPWQDNPVAGIGCQSTYDNQNSIVYFSKKDYQLKPEFKGKVNYVPLITYGKQKGQGDYFTHVDYPGSQFLLGNETLFLPASWTISFDPKNQFFISFHDWHPDLAIPTKKTFLTTKFAGMWKHNDLCNNFCNYYGSNYPFEIELPVNTGQTVTTLKSIEYMLESYRRKNNCYDQFHVLDFNFDRAVIFNSEQVSGYLNLNLFPKNNITLSLDYPKLNANNNSFDVLFSKEENKYRINQFWDITKNRGEFPIGSNYPPTGPLLPGSTILLGNYDQEAIWSTEPNGYVKTLNPINLNYAKPEMQRKKFRHYLNFITFIKDISGDTNMLLKITNTKNQISPR
jgi:hypothetical protein